MTHEERIERELKEEHKRKMAQKKNKLYYDIGTCLRFTENRKMISKTKFKNPEFAKKTFDGLLALHVIDSTYKVYKCPGCNMYHYGSPKDMVK